MVEVTQAWMDDIERLARDANEAARQLQAMTRQLVQALEIAERELARVDRNGADVGDVLVGRARATVSAALSLARSREN